MWIYYTKLGEKILWNFPYFNIKLHNPEISNGNTYLKYHYLCNLKKKFTNVQPLYVFDLVIFYINNYLSRRCRCTVI